MHHRLYKFIIVSITWNSSGWKEPTHERSNFNWVKTHPKASPGESWNFKIDIKKDKHYGFFQYKEGYKPSLFEDGGVIFFFSKDVKHNKNYLVGLYGNASIFETEQKATKYHNLWAPSKYCVRFIDYLSFDNRRYLRQGIRKMPQCSYTYIEEKQAKNIFIDVLKLNSNPQNIELGESPTSNYRKLSVVAKRYFKDIIIPPFKYERKKIPHDRYIGFIEKEIPNFKTDDRIQITKNNAKLKESYERHQRLSNKFIEEVLAVKGYKRIDFKMADITVQKNSTVSIIEVKSCRLDNIEFQIKNAIAQLYYYRYIFCKKHKVHNSNLILLIEKKPNPEWCEFIDSCGIKLWYQENKVLCRYVDRTN